MATTDRVINEHVSKKGRNQKAKKIASSRSPYNQLILADRVHRSIYTDPGIFEDEMVRIFGRTWVYVGHESEIANHGDYKTTRIGKRPVILTRHKDGEIYVLFNQCAHRGTIVCQEGRGNAKKFRCPYHGWTYNTDGSLLGIPYRSGYGPDFDMTELYLARVPRVDSYRGFIFANLSEEGPSLSEYLGDWSRCIDDVYDRSPTGEIIVGPAAHRYYYRGNWKFQLENVVDVYHPPFSHESNMAGRVKLGVGNEKAKYVALMGDDDKPTGDDGTTHGFFPHGHSYFTNVITGQRSGQVFEEYKAALAERIGSYSAEELLHAPSQMVNKACYPNLVIQGDSHVRVPIPIKVDYTEVRVQPILHVGAPAVMHQMVIDHLNKTHAGASFQQTDDVEMFARAQQGLSSMGREWLIIARGLHREADGEGAGERVARGTDELPFRAQYAEWKRLMSAE